ncbi:MAG: acireductone synthase [Pontibacterium sp.]
MTIKAILTDIEGTTTDINFVHKVLFPYARKHLPAFVRDHAADEAVAREIAEVRATLNQPDADVEAVIDQLLAWIDSDTKATPLKTLQGLIWMKGYREQDFTGHVYPDAKAGLDRWKAQGLSLYVFSSGSVKAQQLIFGYSDFGDMCPLFSGYFDTKTGAKREAQAYVTIASNIGLPANEILFLSDITQELDAAKAAGMQTCLLVRGEQPENIQGHPQAANFDEIERVNNA